MGRRALVCGVGSEEDSWDIEVLRIPAGVLANSEWVWTGSEPGVTGRIWAAVRRLARG